MKLLFSLLFCFASLYSKPLEIKLRAKAGLVMNAETGAVLYEKNGYEPAYPGSTTKIATALYVLDEKKVDFGQMVKVSAEAVRRNPGKWTVDTPLICWKVMDL